MTRVSMGRAPGRPSRSSAGRLASALALLLAGCGAAATPGAAPDAFVPPPPLSLVVIVDRSSGRIEQLKRIVQDRATPSETLVVTLPATGPAAATYVVRGGDSLNSIAATYQVSLETLEAANPQLGPVAGRDWNRIFPGERVTVPDAQAGHPATNLVVTRAPSGPPPPALVRLPRRPPNATSFQVAQYERAVRAAQATNRARLAAWSSAAALRVEPWQRQVAAQLESIAGSLARSSDGRLPGDLSASIGAAATTLTGLPGRRVLLLDGGLGGPPGTALAAGSLAGMHLVVANLPDPAAAVAWTNAAAAAGASVTTLDPALTELQLPAAVNARDR